MYYTIYKTVNKSNQKVYYGKHVTDDLYDGYLGSGKYLKSAIKKYGKGSFEKFVLFTFDSEEEMNLKEKELITEDVVKDKSTYNLKVGGEGGWDASNRHPASISARVKTAKEMSKKWMDKFQNDKQFREEHIKRSSERMKRLNAEGKIRHDTFTGRKHTEDTKKKMSENHADITGNKNPMYGKQHTEETKRKIRQSLIGNVPWNKGRKTK